MSCTLNLEFQLRLLRWVFRRGAPFDLKNGYDFNKDVDRCRAWRKLKKERPDLLIVCPPCGPFSQLQSWNYKRMEKGKAMVILWGRSGPLRVRYEGVRVAGA